MFGGNWPLTGDCLQALVLAGFETMLVTPGITLRQRARQLVAPPQSAVERQAEAAGVDVLRYGENPAFGRALRRFRPDLIAIATFPVLLPASILEVAPAGAVNLHPSLLPRHRGTFPLFWVYREDDRQAGLTVHTARDRFDAGPILAQQRFPLERGYPVEALARDLVARSGSLLVDAIAAVEAGAVPRVQDERAATRAPRIDLSTFRPPLHEWDVERAWHFLKGFASRYRLPLVDDRGATIHYASVSSLERGIEGPVGVTVRDADGWLLHCRGGVIRLVP